MVDQQVLGLQVSVDNLLLVQVEQPVEDLNEVESGIFLGHPLHLLQVVEKFPTRAVYDKSKQVQSRTRHTKFDVSNAWLSRTMNGWFNCEDMFFSFYIIDYFWVLEMNFLSITFMA